MRRRIGKRDFDIMRKLSPAQLATIEDAYLSAIESQHGDLGGRHAILMMALHSAGINVNSWQQALQKAEEALYETQSR